MDPITAIKGLETEVNRLTLQDTFNDSSLMDYKNEQKHGLHIEIIKQLMLVKPKAITYGKES